MSAYVGFWDLVKRVLVQDDLILVLRIIVLVCPAPMS